MISRLVLQGVRHAAEVHLGARRQLVAAAQLAVRHVERPEGPRATNGPGAGAGAGPGGGAAHAVAASGAEPRRRRVRRQLDFQRCEEHQLRVERLRRDALHGGVRVEPPEGLRHLRHGHERAALGPRRGRGRCGGARGGGPRFRLGLGAAWRRNAPCERGVRARCLEDRCDAAALMSVLGVEASGGVEAARVSSSSRGEILSPSQNAPLVPAAPAAASSLRSCS